MFDLDNSTARRHAPEPDLVPILDGLTAVIFFMLLSISFVGITKLTLPPSAVSTASPSKEPPLSGRVVAKLEGETINVKIEWLGNTPGSYTEKATRIDAAGKNASLLDAVEKLAQRFKEKFPDEKTLQIAISSEMNYQELVSIMDGLRKNEMYEDLVLSSYTEAD
jgi:biopolymer transport protein ExbD